MKRQAELKLVAVNGYQYIYIYFKAKGQMLRINTGNKYIASQCRKDLMYNTQYDGYEQANKRTAILLNRVNEYIDSKYASSVSPIISNKECIAYIDDKNYRIDYKGSNVRMSTSTNRIASTGFLGIFETFIGQRTNTLATSSINNYNYVLGLLKDFQTYRRKALSFDEIDLNFVNELYRFFISKGLTDNTSKYLFKIIKIYFHYLENEGICTIQPTVYGFKIKTVVNDVFALSNDQLKHLNSIRTSGSLSEHKQKCLDLFIFNCYIGLRYSDLKQLNVNNFINNHIEITTNKTAERISIPLHPIAKEIAVKYEYRLPSFAVSGYNTHLKAICKEFNVIDDVYEHLHSIGSKVIREYIVGNDMISSHSARKTFITLNISNGMAINELMALTGHKELQTIQKYLKKTIPSKILM